MVETRIPSSALGVVIILVLAGCLGWGPVVEESSPTPSPFAGPVLAVTEVPQSDVTSAPNTSMAQYESLDAGQQAEFREALASDVRNPTAWEDGTDIEYVYYNGTWYSAQVHIVK